MPHMEDIIKKYIYLDKEMPEYIVVLPPVVKMAMYLSPLDYPSKPAPTIVAVYSFVGGEPDLYCYEFVGVEIR